MNTFCMKECTGYNRHDVRRCRDRNCPFYPFRFANISYEDDREIREKLTRETRSNTDCPTV